MENYLEQLRNKPDHHKKYFALGVSGCFTALMFLIWSFTTFGGAGAVVAKAVPDEEVKAVSPFDNLGSGVASAWSAIKDRINNAGTKIENSNLDDKYQNIRNDALNTQYGQ